VTEYVLSGTTDELAVDGVRRGSSGWDEAVDCQDDGASSSVSPNDGRRVPDPSVVQDAEGILSVQVWMVSGGDVTAKSVSNPPGLNGGRLPKPVPLEN